MHGRFHTHPPAIISHVEEINMNIKEKNPFHFLPLTRFPSSPKKKKKIAYPSIEKISGKKESKTQPFTFPLPVSWTVTWDSLSVKTCNIKPKKKKKNSLLL